MAKSIVAEAVRAKLSCEGQPHRGRVCLEWAPVFPSALFPQGMPGIMRITSHTKRGEVVKTYTLQALAGKNGTLEGWRLTQHKGPQYDVPASLEHCECFDFLKHHAPCKHIRSLCALLNRGDLPTGPDDVGTL